ncbi:TonB-dependent receptor [Paraburkholderia megapolitana]|uniref:TonB-dependent receptor n=1 Tax=Paraburkholderia megapolitana TaxID=420953 RepID=UPI0038BC371C
MKQKVISFAIRRIVSGAATAGVALTLASTPQTAFAQERVSDDEDSRNGRAKTQGSGQKAAHSNVAPDASERGALPAISITAQTPANTNEFSTGIARLADTVKEMPQTVNVIPHELIEQQKATSLEQILKNVPGITIATGEGNGGQNGDQFKIRGLSAKGDIYIDGLRDFGAYRRDSFDTESVQVIKGPSGDSFGVGSIGGLINQTSKQARLKSATSIEQSGGSGSTYRTTVDSNIKLGDTTAVRVNGMYQNGNTPDRDNVKDNRAGVAIDFGTGIGTHTEWHLGYSYLRRDGVPDYGMPTAQGADGFYRPILEYNVPGLDSSTSYVRNTDRDKSDTHIVSSLFTKKLDNGIQIDNDTRFTFYERDFSSTHPAAVSSSNLKKLLAGQNLALPYGADGGVVYLQRGLGVQNVTTAKAEFNLGALRNRAVFGLDMNYQRDHRDQGTWTGRVNNQTVVNPQYQMPPGWSLSYGNTTRDAQSSDIGVFANDRIWLTQQFSLLGNLRWDYFRSKYWTSAASLTGGTASSSKVSPGISAIWEPTKDAMFYTSFSRTYRPIGTDIALAVGGRQSEVPTNGVDSVPERSDTVEVGTKLDFLNKRLGVTAALFQTRKSRSYAIEPDTGELSPGFSDNGEGYRIRGVELGLSGRITENWSANIAYAYLNGMVNEASAATSIGKTAPGVSNNNMTVWTSYLVPHSLIPLPGRLTVGGGLQYASGYWVNSANTARVPENFSLDGMVGYEQGPYRISLNLYNLTDHLNYQSAFSTSRAVPASRRTFLLSAGAKF